MQTLMKAITVGQPPQLELTLSEAPIPEISPSQVLIAVKAAGVNRADLYQRQGTYPPSAGASTILGLEVAGIITQLGSQVRDFNIGDPVFTLLEGGGYAEMVAAESALLHRLPPQLDFTQAAALPECLYTAFLNIFLEGALSQGEKVLIHAGGSGVGSLALKLLNISGHTAYTTVGSPEKALRCRKLGAQEAIVYKEESFAAKIAEFTNGSGVDLILDCVGGDYLSENLKSLANLGRLVMIDCFKGSKAEIPLGLLIKKRLKLIGSVLRPRTLSEKIIIKSALEAAFGDSLNRGLIKAEIEATFPLSQAAEAHQLLNSSKHFGKVVLTV